MHIAIMEGEVVARRRWLTRDEFLDLLGAAYLIPGPNSTELALHIGYRFARWQGLLAAGCAFILPAVLIATGAAWMYTRIGRTAEAAAILYGIKPVAMAVIAQAIWVLSRSAVKNVPLAALGVMAVAATLAGIHELIILAAAVLIGLTAGGISRARAGVVAAIAALTNTSLTAQVIASGAVASFGLTTLFLTMGKIGAVLFGSGYVLVAFLRADLIDRLGWLTEAQLLDAVAIGQIVPGPVFTTATFIGFVLGGLPGAAAATLGIFLPAFIFVAVSGPLVPALRRSPVTARVLDAVNVASLALMIGVLWWLASSALVDPLTVALSIASFVGLVNRVQPAALLVGGALVGWLAVAAG